MWITDKSLQRTQSLQEWIKMGPKQHLANVNLSHCFYKIHIKLYSLSLTMILVNFLKIVVGGEQGCKKTANKLGKNEFLQTKSSKSFDRLSQMAETLLD